VSNNAWADAIATRRDDICRICSPSCRMKSAGVGKSGRRC
jgi:hypothetical protein